MNNVSIIGNLVRDPEVKYLPSGTPICEISIAYNEVWYNDAKEKQERTHFFGAVAFAGRAESIAKYFVKGQKIAIEGMLSQETWDDKQTGNKREKTKIKITGFDFCGDKKGEAGATQSAPAGRSAPAKAAADPDLDNLDVDSEVPF